MNINAQGPGDIAYYVRTSGARASGASTAEITQHQLDGEADAAAFWRAREAAGLLAIAAELSARNVVPPSNAVKKPDEVAFFTPLAEMWTYLTGSPPARAAKETNVFLQMARSGWADIFGEDEEKKFHGALTQVSSALGPGEVAMLVRMGPTWAEYLIAPIEGGF